MGSHCDNANLIRLQFFGLRQLPVGFPVEWYVG